MCTKSVKTRSGKNNKLGPVILTRKENKNFTFPDFCILCSMMNMYYDLSFKCMLYFDCKQMAAEEII